MALQEDNLYVALTRPPKKAGVSYTAMLTCFIVTGLFMGVFGHLLPNIFYGIALFCGLFVICYLIEQVDDRAFRLLWLWSKTVARCPIRVRLYWKGDTRTPLPAQSVKWK